MQSDFKVCNVDVVVNFLSPVIYYYYFCFVSTSLAYSTLPCLKTKEDLKQKLPEIKINFQHLCI